MARSPAAEIENLDKVPLESLEPGSPQYNTKMKLLKEEEWRKKNSVVVDQWIEYHHNSSHPKGGKVLLKKRMKDVKDEKGNLLKAGNVHCFYLGRLKKGGREAVDAYLKKGVQIREGKQHFKS